MTGHQRADTFEAQIVQDLPRRSADDTHKDDNSARGVIQTGSSPVRHKEDDDASPNDSPSQENLTMLLNTPFRKVRQPLRPVNAVSHSVRHLAPSVADHDPVCPSGFVVHSPRGAGW